MRYLTHLELFLLLLLVITTLLLVWWDQRLVRTTAERNEAVDHAIEAQRRTLAAQARVDWLETRLRRAEMQLHPAYSPPEPGEQLAAEAEAFLRGER